MYVTHRLRILRCSAGPPAVTAALRAALPQHQVDSCAEESILPHVAEADVIIPARGKITAAVLDAAPRCRLIQQMGTGVDMVDVTAAAERGIPVANVPSNVSGTAESVAEMALLLTLGVLRNQALLAHAVRVADWQQLPMGRTLWQRTVGIVGVGAIGGLLAQLLRPFGCRVLGVKRSPAPSVCEQLGLTWLGGMQQLPELLREAEVVVLTLPLTPETRGLMGRAELNQMPPGSYLVNISRGALVDRAALLEALASGHLAGAGLDVFWDEPANPADPLFQHNVFVTPHTAGYTELMLRRASAAVAANIQRLLEGEPLLYRQN